MKLGDEKRWFRLFLYCFLLILSFGLEVFNPAAKAFFCTPHSGAIPDGLTADEPKTP